MSLPNIILAFSRKHNIFYVPFSILYPPPTFPFKFQFRGESPLTLPHALHGANRCPSPLDPELQCKLQFGGQCPRTMRHALHGANRCPSPLDPELQCKLQFGEQLDRRNRLPNILSLRAIPKNGVAIPIDFREKTQIGRGSPHQRARWFAMTCVLGDCPLNCNLTAAETLPSRDNG